MFKSTKLNKFCICFRGLKLGPNPPFRETSRSFPIDFNKLFIQPPLGLKLFVIKLLSFFSVMQTGFDEAGMHYMSVKTRDMSF